MSKKTKKSQQHPSTPADPSEPISAEDSEPATTDQAGGDGDTAAPLTPEQELDELKDRYQRLGADYANYQRRAQRQIEQAAQFASEEFARKLLPVLDNFDHTLDKGADANDVSSLLKGIQIVHDHLFDIMTNVGLQRIEVAAGTPFDPTRHEAMLHQESTELPADSVMAELGTGYTMNDRTLRPAKVSIVKAPAAPAEPVELVEPAEPVESTDAENADQNTPRPEELDQ